MGISGMHPDLTKLHLDNGATILDAVEFADGRFVVLARQDGGAQPFVTWEARYGDPTNGSAGRGLVCHWGHYFGDIQRAVADFADRIEAGPGETGLRIASREYHRAVDDACGGEWGRQEVQGGEGIANVLMMPGRIREYMGRAADALVEVARTRCGKYLEPLETQSQRDIDGAWQDNLGESPDY